MHMPWPYANVCLCYTLATRTYAAKKKIECNLVVVSAVNFLPENKAVSNGKRRQQQMNISEKREYNT